MRGASRKQNDYRRSSAPILYSLCSIPQPENLITLLLYVWVEMSTQCSWK